MTTYTSTDRTTTAPAWPLFAALGAGIALVLTAIGTFWDVTGNDTAGRDSLANYLPVVGVVLVATALVFGLVVRTATPASAGVRGLVLGVLAILSILVFWTGLPAVLALGSIACALRAPGMPVTAKVALGLSVVALAVAVFAAITG